MFYILRKDDANVTFDFVNGQMQTRCFSLYQNLKIFAPLHSHKSEQRFRYGCRNAHQVYLYEPFFAVESFFEFIPDILPFNGR